jgi:molybdopterin-synthase adenylyltransferase
MSDDDIDAECGHAAQTLVITEMPLLGMTLGTGEMSWSARIWPTVARGPIERRDFESVRVVGDRLRITFNPAFQPPPVANARQLRTVSAWGEHVQADIARTCIGVVGAGNVGSIVAEALARTGVQHVVLIDIDSVKEHNLDRLLHADLRDVELARSKVETLRRALLRSATAENPRIDAHEVSIVEQAGLAAALDCDVIFSCVDRPWARSVLNFVAYAHLIPVVDGGIRVVTTGDRLERADWKAHVAAPGRRCLECARQYDPGLVSVERDGYLDDPRYIAGLPKGHPLIATENVFAFGAHTAAMEVMQMLSMAVAPQGIADIGAHNYHFVTGELDTDFHACTTTCPYEHRLLARGDAAGITVTGHHQAADAERAARHVRQRTARARFGRALDDLLRR